MSYRFAVIILVCLTISSCGFFSRTKSEFYTLETLPPDQQVAAAGEAPVGIEAIELPPGLDRRGIVVRESRHQLQIRETHQWTETLETMVLHTLAHDLAERLPAGMMVLPGQPKPAGPMRSITVVFDDLTPGPEPLFRLDARWGSVGGSISHERIEVPMSSLESDEVATAMSAAIATLADRIVAAIE
ncbi:MAG: PqiC family protein [Acidobacteria bacterium]|nr:PqiC family protein [Acidobacteriota bacterium]